MPRLAIIQAEGANPLYQAYFSGGFKRFRAGRKAQTIATAIKIGNPVNLQKAIRTLEWTGGVVEEVSDQQIMDAKALIDGVGHRLRTGLRLFGGRRTKKLVENGTIKPGDTVLGCANGSTS